MRELVQLLLSGTLLIWGASQCLANESGRMTGGGSIFKGDVRITHGFELHCGPIEGGLGFGEPNNLEINWNGNHFHLETLIFGVCTLNGDPTPPSAPFTDYDGAGWGSYNGAPGARASWRFTDYGEPGTNDLIIRLTIVDGSGQTVLDVTTPTALTFGNHQAHRDN